MFRFKVRRWKSLIIVVPLALSACAGEIPPELLKAAVAVESGEVEVEGIEVEFSGFADELEFTGEVQSVSAGEWMIADLSFIVQPQTEVKGNPQVGDQVKVHASLTADGALLAREIEPAENFEEDDDDALPFDLEDEMEFFGVVETINPDQWTIAGRTVFLLPQTEVEGAITTGDLVKVHAFLNAAGELAAREIELATSDDESDDNAFDLEHEIEFYGAIEAMGGEIWTITGRTILILPETEIKGTLSVGDLVKVHAFLNATGELAAREIEPAIETEMTDDDMDDDHDLKLKGILEQIGEDVWVIDGVSFRVSADTEIEDGLAVGDFVEVYFFAENGDLPLAREIESDDDDDADEDDDLDLDDDEDEDDEDEDDDDHDEDDDDHDDDHDDSDDDDESDDD